MQVRGSIMKTWSIQDTNKEQLVEDQGKGKDSKGMNKIYFK